LERKKRAKNDNIRRAKKLFHNSENIISSFEEGRRKKLDRSYAMVLLNSKEQKDKLIRPDFRAFGLLIGSN